MAIRFYDTLRRASVPFEPQREGHAGIYGCGPTVYQLPHIGNYRTFLFNDLLHRWLAWKGYDVRMVMNLTDVDDRIIDLAAEQGVSIGEYVAPYVDGFFAELDTLGARPAHVYPRATEHIDDMVALVQSLVENGHAYEVEGSVYYDIGSFDRYGKLSRIPLDDVRTGERVASDNYEKQDARDFALWKAAKDVDRQVGAAWPSPWGEGRPGWHLECSAMSMAELGPTLDIHTGGEDLVFPHHEDEIAQSEGATGETFARTWLHAKHLLLDTEKMSKSLGNVVRLEDVLAEGFEPAAVRWLLLSAHYRSELSFSYAALRDASSALRRVVEFRDRLRDVAGGGEVAVAAPLRPARGDGEGGDGTHGTDGGDPAGREARDPSSVAGLADRFLVAFEEALEDDLNSPAALGALFLFVRRANTALDDAMGANATDRGDGASTREAARTGLAALAAFDDVFGVIALADRGAGVDSDLAAWADERVAARQQARADSDWAAADAIRDELAEAGIVVEDTPQGPRWKKAASAG
jgi:cysteinyl-tRNA synthetase